MRTDELSGLLVHIISVTNKNFSYITCLVQHYTEKMTESYEKDKSLVQTDK